jgi:hypothetical protein
MIIKLTLLAGTALSILWFAVGASTAAQAQQPKGAPAVATPSIDADDIGGVVTSRFGAEAGVWVVAETTELGTRFAKMVVTDDFGRYVIPDLPKATYRVWVRGYGLVESPKATTEPGKTVNLTAVIAPSLQAAAQYYPAIYWASMIRVPDRSQFPGTGADGNGIPVNFKAQDQWLNMVKTNGCGNCHQLGNYATRNIPDSLGHFDSSMEAWARRIQSGPAGRDHGALHGAATDSGRGTPQGTGRLDRSHQGRRDSKRDAAASGRSRAQSRRHRARLVGP